MVDKPDSYLDAKWIRKLVGCPLIINLIHEIYCLWFIIGEIESVQAIASNTNRRSEIGDTISITMKFENGALGSFILSDTIASPYSWEMSSGQVLYFSHQPGNYYFFGAFITLLKHNKLHLIWQVIFSTVL